jgi:hypothetical protein
MITEPEQVPPLTTIPEQEPLENISEIPQENLTAEPNSEPENTQPQATNQPQIAEQSPIIVETLNNDTSLSSYPSSPTSEQLTQVYGPVYKPLTYGEIVIPSDQILPFIEDIMKQSIDIDDTFELPPLNAKVDISKIIIKPLKRKRPEPKIPFNSTLNQTLSF